MQVSGCFYPLVTMSGVFGRRQSLPGIFTDAAGSLNFL
jgi:hypothetical protein